MKKVAIIGAGASGLICSIVCAKNSCKVDLYEQNQNIGKKILVSGNGRCNITNTSFSEDDYFSQNNSFVKDALERFNYQKFEKFCASIGLVLDAKEDGKVYPLSNEAKSVVAIFKDTALNLGVNIITDTKISDIKSLMDKYDAVVVATGSEAASHLGGCADGLEFAKVYGHSIIPTYPSLVQLELSNSPHNKMSGTKVDGEVTLMINNQKSSSASGDILFTAYGVSGFAILDISREASEAMLNYSVVDIILNLLPKYSHQKLSNHLNNLNKSIPESSILNALHALLPLKISKTILDVLNISHETKLQNLNMKDYKRIANQCLNWKFEVASTHGFRHAEVAGGGVNTDEIDAKTMESKKQKSLYFTGEVLDVVGRRGGYNFAWGWASGYAAAIGISSK
ncbi:MAG: NAD(P)/FAD-dependent oxidoreductase [Thiovulaceae bacterium]|nr:NAD(P)/FAD-dependent oxidoreductase [Sulfurimonadaceae bacterium]MCW9025678.1 NAD(P)/FAD-dependent oxidoreductase [Sulfurimonadaceae bacterium]